MTAPPPPFAANGLRAQATSGDARAERLVHTLRIEVAGLKQSLDAWSEAREDMVELDLAAVQASPEAAATLPPMTLVAGLVRAAERVADLEQERDADRRQAEVLRDELSRLQDEHAYTRGRLETLHEVIAALHGNLQDFRFERDRPRSMATPAPSAMIGPAGSNGPTLGMSEQRAGDAPQ